MHAVIYNSNDSLLQLNTRAFYIVQQSVALRSVVAPFAQIFLSIFFGKRSLLALQRGDYLVGCGTVSRFLSLQIFIGFHSRFGTFILKNMKVLEAADVFYCAEIVKITVCTNDQSCSLKIL